MESHILSKRPSILKFDERVYSRGKCSITRPRTVFLEILLPDTFFHALRSTWVQQKRSASASTRLVGMNEWPNQRSNETSPDSGGFGPLAECSGHSNQGEAQ